MPYNSEVTIEPDILPTTPALLRVLTRDGATALALWRGGSLLDLSTAEMLQLRTLDGLLSLPLERVRSLLDDPYLDALPSLDPWDLEWLAPAEGQEVWAAGVTYLRSRQARLEEAAAKDVYTRVYEAERPELFFKAAGWRVIPHGGAVGVRSDSDWNVPEPELAVLSNAYGEVVAYSCGNDVSSRSIEGENPLYLPQAKVYDASCSIGPAAVLAWNVRPSACSIQMTIEREGQEIFSSRAGISDMVRDPAELVGVLHAAYTLPVGAWLMTGTSIVPDRYTATPDDIIRINIEGIGELRNTIKRIEHSGATAPPRAR
jgi:2-dehydro-3-deoxy-D-arabinonate dehydratase